MPMYASMVAPEMRTVLMISNPSTPKNRIASSRSNTATVTWSNVAPLPMRSRSLVELDVVAFRIAEERAAHEPTRRFAVHRGVGAGTVTAAQHHGDVGLAHARQHRVQVVDPEREVVHTHLEELRGFALDVVRDLLVEHDEAGVRTLDPTQIDGAPLGRRLTGALRELLDLVRGHAQTEDIAVEAERHLHVAHADRDVGHRFDRHGRGHYCCVRSRSSR